MSTSDEQQVHATWWTLVLADWRRAGAQVRIATRGGVMLGPGLVKDLPSSTRGPVVTLHGRIDGRETRWDVDLSEVAAVEAVASR